MPLYEYECESCGLRFEVIQRFSDPAVDHCKRCNGPVHKLLSAPAIQFKGTGWYVTDYARKGAGSATTPPSHPSSDKSGKDKTDSAGSTSSSSSTSATDAGSSSKAGSRSTDGSKKD